MTPKEAIAYFKNCNITMKYGTENYFKAEEVTNLAIKALEIADRLKQADARQNVGKHLGEMEEWVRVSTNEYSYFKGYAQALADIRGEAE